jgi:hypothetical protein
MEMFDQLVVTRFITDEEQLAEIEFNEAQEVFCEASCKWADSKEPCAMEAEQEAEVRLLNAFFRREDDPIMRKAWAAYRRRLLFKHRHES